MKMLDKPCHGCPFTGSSLVSPARVKDIVQELTRKDCHFVCHKSTTAPRFAKRNEELVCRGYYEKVYLNTGVGQLVRIMERLGGVAIVALTPEEEAEALASFSSHKELEKKPRRRRRAT